MSAAPVIAAGVAVAVLVGTARAGPPLAAPAPATRAREADERALLRRLRPVLTPVAFLGGWLLVGGALGVPAGAALAAATWRAASRIESPAAVRRRARMRADLPFAVHLLADALRAGAAVEAALGTVAEAMPGPCAEEFRSLRHRLALGMDPAQVWLDLADHPELAPLGRALGRAHETGAAVADNVSALATELRSRARAEVEQRAKRVDVRASAPLGVCFLPGFVLLGVVPLVVGLFASMHLFS